MEISLVLKTPERTTAQQKPPMAAPCLFIRKSRVS